MKLTSLLDQKRCQINDASLSCFIVGEIQGLFSQELLHAALLGSFAAINLDLSVTDQLGRQSIERPQSPPMQALHF